MQHSFSLVRRIVSVYARPASYSSGGVNRSRQEWISQLGVAAEKSSIIIHPVRGYNDHILTDGSIEFAHLRHYGRSRQMMVPVRLERFLKADDLVYLHEGWTLSNYIIGLYCRFRDIPYVVMPHGVYAPGIVSTLRLLRFRTPFEKWLLEGAAGVHLFFDSEVAELKAVAPRANAFVATTGFRIQVRVWEASSAGDYLAWVGRLDVLHKGIDVLFEAMSRIPVPERPKLKMAGPDYAGGRAETERLVVSYGLEDSIDLVGPLSQAEVADLLLGSRGFVHFPRWEAFGRTIAEALALGVPVGLGRGAHIAKFLEGSAAIADNEPDSISAVLRELWGGKVDGMRGRRWLEDNLGWDHSAQKAVQEIEALLTRRVRRNKKDKRNHS